MEFQSLQSFPLTRSRDASRRPDALLSLHLRGVAGPLGPTTTSGAPVPRVVSFRETRRLIDTITNRTLAQLLTSGLCSPA